MVVHTLLALPRQRGYAVALGHEDVNDHGAPRDDLVPRTVRRRQRRRAAVRRDVAIREIRLDTTPTRAWRLDPEKGTIRHRRSSTVGLV
jgi:hypothetical protein